MRKILYLIIAMSLFFIPFNVSIAGAETQSDQEGKEEALTTVEDIYRTSYKGVEIIINSSNSMITPEKMIIAKKVIDSE